MGLKNKLIIQNVILIAITVCATLLSILIYSYFYERFTQKPAPGIYNTGLIVITDGDRVIHASSQLSEAQIGSLMIDIKTNASKVMLNDQPYLVTSESFQIGNDTPYTAYSLTPSINITSYYKNMAAFLICVFLIAFILTAQSIARYNHKHIIKPIVSLNQSALKLANGELDTVIDHDGIGEISNLCDSVEQLRLKLKESIYFRKKTDDNRKFLLSGISHDLRTPVTAIRGYIEGILDGVAITEEKKTAYLKTALKKTDTISLMIDDLLLYSKLDLNTLPFELTKINIAVYLEEYTAEMQNDFQRKNKQLTFENALSQERFVTVDTSKFNRVLQNILSNAEKNIAEHTGKVIISLRENNSSVIIEIRDNGRGIKEEDLPNIFTRFYRGDAARIHDGSSGLGLTIAKQIVEGLGGRIWALSKEGQGAAILISLKKNMDKE